MSASANTQRPSSLALKQMAVLWLPAFFQFVACVLHIILEREKNGIQFHLTICRMRLTLANNRPPQAESCLCTSTKNGKETITTANFMSYNCQVIYI